MEVGQGPNWGCSAKEKKKKIIKTEIFKRLPPCNRIITNKLAIILMIKKFFVLYGTRRFTTVAIVARYCPLESILTPTLRFIYVLSSQLRQGLQNEFSLRISD
jgi:hypothetical protein